jgi:hypothetical protein
MLKAARSCGDFVELTFGFDKRFARIGEGQLGA